MRVEVFSSYTEAKLSEKINNFIESNSIDVIDIKFSATFFYMSAIVMYESEKVIE